MKGKKARKGRERHLGNSGERKKGQKERNKRIKEKKRNEKEKKTNKKKRKGALEKNGMEETKNTEMRATISWKRKWVTNAV